MKKNFQLKVKKLHPEAKLPSYAHPGDVGLDMYALENFEVKPGEHVRVNHGFALEFQEGYGAFVMDKSSVSKAGLKTLGGVFDAGYRGEYNTQLVNLGTETYHIEKGDKVSQLVISPVVIAELEETDTLGESSRGEGRFGSTGKK
jgi:dUTP pyrophosphatase